MMMNSAVVVRLACSISRRESDCKLILTLMSQLEYALVCSIVQCVYNINTPLPATYSQHKIMRIVLQCRSLSSCDALPSLSPHQKNFTALIISELCIQRVGAIVCFPFFIIYQSASAPLSPQILPILHYNTSYILSMIIIYYSTILT